MSEKRPPPNSYDARQRAVEKTTEAIVRSTGKSSEEVRREVVKIARDQDQRQGVK